MRFSAEHRFPAPRTVVSAVLGDPDFYRRLDLPDLRLLDVRRIGSGEHGGDPSPESGLVLRYEFTGDLDPVAHRLLGGAQLTWSQETHLRGDAGGRLVFAAEASPRLLHGHADFSLDREGVGTVRRLEGNLEVAVPVLGGMAERRIVPGVLRRLDVEANAIRASLTPS